MLGIQKAMQKLYPGVTLKNFARHVGRELGVVRVSLGLASDFRDVWRVVQFASRVGRERSRLEMWARWVEANIAAGGDTSEVSRMSSPPF